MKKLILSSAVVLGAAALVYSNFQSSDSERNFTSRNDFNIENGYRGYAEYYEKIRSDVKTGKYNPINREVALQEVDELRSLKRSNDLNLDWIDMGPDNVGGRTRAIVVDKDDPRTIYAGSVAGGLWRSTNFGGLWSKVESFNQNIVIASMAQLPNGKFIIGTGSTFESGGGTGGSGFAGYGIYISEDNMQTFNHAVNQDGDFLRPQQFANSGSHVYNNEIINDPTNPDAVWIAYDRGIARYNTVTKEFTRITAPGMTGVGQDVDVSADGQTVVAVVSAGFFNSTPFISKDAGQTWVNLRTEGKLTVPPLNNSGRLEAAISKDDKNYIYLSMSQGNGTLFGVYGTENGGDNWVSLLPGTVPSFNYFNNQGNYDQAIEVIPGQPGVVILGGVTMWRGGFDAAAEQIALNFAPVGDNRYVHSDIHEFTFGQDGTLWIGCDGGIHRSKDNATTFTVNNRGYNVTTFYDIDFSNDGRVLGGAQDNGSQLIEFKGITPQTARQVTGGDGFDVGFSKTNSSISFSTIQFGALFRSLDALSYESFYDARAGAAANNTQFNTTFQFYENDDDPLSQNFVVYENTTGNEIPPNTKLVLDSKTLGRTFEVITPDSVILPNQKISFKDPYTSIFASGFTDNNGVWITRGAMQFGQIPVWFRVLETQGSIEEIEFGADGTLYATNGRTLYRITGLQNAWKFSNASLDGNDSVKVFESDVIWPNSSNIITSISADPNNANRLLVTRGNYNGGAHVYICENALDDNPNFVAIQGDLPDFPVYAGRIDMFEPNRLVIGTEVGVFASEDLGQTWLEKNEGDMDRVPVFEVAQQTRFFGGPVTNTGFYYLGTHGRGAFRAENLFNSVSEKENKFAEHNITVYPNPTVKTLNVNTGLDGEQLVEIFNNAGQIVYSQNVRSNGTVLSVDVNNLKNGNYIVRAKTLDGFKTAHFIKQ